MNAIFSPFCSCIDFAFSVSAPPSTGDRRGPGAPVSAGAAALRGQGESPAPGEGRSRFRFTRAWEDNEAAARGMALNVQRAPLLAGTSRDRGAPRQRRRARGTSLKEWVMTGMSRRTGVAALTMGVALVFL